MAWDLNLEELDARCREQRRYNPQTQRWHLAAAAMLAAPAHLGLVPSPPVIRTSGRPEPAIVEAMLTPSPVVAYWSQHSMKALLSLLFHR